MIEPIVLYSTNSRLSFHINEKFYKQIHYVWCTPFFSSKSRNSYEITTARSSIPSEIYSELYKDCKSDDLHSARIQSNRIGLLKGASAKFKQGVITSQQLNDIRIIVKRAKTSDFTPLIYIIPYNLVQSKIEPVPVGSRASLLSDEMRILELPRKCFDVIDFDLN